MRDFRAHRIWRSRGINLKFAPSKSHVTCGFVVTKGETTADIVAATAILGCFRGSELETTAEFVVATSTPGKPLRFSLSKNLPDGGPSNPTGLAQLRDPRQPGTDRQ
jgi:hypothetical protein